MNGQVVPATGQNVVQVVGGQVAQALPGQRLGSIDPTGSPLERMVDVHGCSPRRREYGLALKVNVKNRLVAIDVKID